MPDSNDGEHNRMQSELKPLVFLGNTRRALVSFPEQVRRDFGHLLHLIQSGDTPTTTKPLSGFPVHVREIRLHYDKETYRSVYTVALGDRVYLLHVFHKKSKRGIATPKHDLEVIRSRLKEAERLERHHHG